MPTWDPRSPLARAAVAGIGQPRNQECLACGHIVQTWAEWFGDECPETDTGHVVPDWRNLPFHTGE
mgnify:CR=1 FL=1